MMRSYPLVTAILASKTVLAQDPICTPLTSAATWYKCTDDTNAWYGIVESSEGVESANEKCIEAGGQPVAVTNAGIDTCAYYTMYYEKTSDSTGYAQDQFVYYSGERVDGVWSWCPEGSECTDFTYENWAEDVNPTSGPACMGGALNADQYTFQDYAWNTANCANPGSTSKIMCRVDCGELINPGQYLAIGALSYDDQNLKTYTHNIFVYKIVDNNVQADPLKFKYPYSPCNLPNLVWNHEQNALELAGDKLLGDTGRNYGFLKLDGSFAKNTQSNYDGRWGTAMIYTDTLGTIMAGGGTYLSNEKVGSTIQTYMPQSWDQTSDVSFPDLNYPRIRLTGYYYGGAIYTAGGGEFLYVDGVFNSLEVMYGVDAVQGPDDVANLEWTILPPLSVNGTAGNIHFLNDIMYFYGYTGEVYTGNPINSTYIELYNIDDNTSQVYPEVFNTYNYLPGSYVSETTMTVFGGFGRMQPDFTERASFDDVTSWSFVESNFSFPDNGQSGPYIAYDTFTIQ